MLASGPADRLLLLVLMALTVGDGVLNVILFDRFGEVYAQFLNIFTAFHYLMASSVILLRRRLRRSRDCCGPERVPVKGSLIGTSAPWCMLLALGLLNGSANFLLGVSQPHTAGLTQSLLSLLSVPFVMLLSFLLLRCTTSAWALCGATLIVAGGAISCLRNVMNDATGNGGVETFYYSMLLFIGAQLVLAFEKVLEEWVFRGYRGQDAMQMFWFTMLVQFCLYIPLLPTQTMPQFGGLSLSEIPLIMWDGVQCVFGIASQETNRRDLPECGLANTLLFFSYVAVDMSCYFCGLYVIQQRGANMMTIASISALPLQQVIFCLPFLGTYVETFFGSDLGALLLVCAGYGIYQLCSPEGRQDRIPINSNDSLCAR